MRERQTSAAKAVTRAATTARLKPCPYEAPVER